MIYKLLPFIIVFSTCAWFLGIVYYLKKNIKGESFSSINQKKRDMGLDMYLTRVEKDYNGNETTSDVGYWRKANAIHNWFVQELADGVDECQEIKVTMEDLYRLRDLCKQLLKDRDDKEAQDKLPTTRGFFFGTTEYDEGYWYDLEKTALIIDYLDYMSSYRHEGFIYQASW